MPPRTIDNLGIDISTRYARDQNELDTSLIKEAGKVSEQAQIDVSFPSFTSEWEAMFEMGNRTLPWADFHAPEKYSEQKKRLFTHNIFPGMGDENKKEAIMLRVSTFTFTQEEGDKEKEKKMAWEEEKEKEDEEKEKKTILALLNTIQLLDKLLVDVNARRGQYQRG